MHPDVKEIILSEETLRARVRELGEEITRDYDGQTVLLVAVLRGAALGNVGPLLRALEVTGVGKATSMGFGTLAATPLP